MATDKLDITNVLFSDLTASIIGKGNIKEGWEVLNYAEGMQMQCAPFPASQIFAY